jgi:hypothetical protein
VFLSEIMSGFMFLSCDLPQQMKERATMRAELQTSPPLTPSTTQHIASICIEQLACSVVSCRPLTLSGSHTISPTHIRIAPVTEQSLPMAGEAGNGEQLPKKQNHSRLRNEVRPQSTDDERDRTGTAVQVPNSDTIVPETQPSHVGDFHHDDPVADNESEFSLSPNSAALLERTAVTKKTETTQCVPFFGKLLSRNPVVRNDSSASAAPSSNPFATSYSQTRKVFSKPPPKEDATARRSTCLGLRTLDTQKHKGNASRGKSASYPSSI